MKAESGYMYIKFRKRIGVSTITYTFVTAVHHIECALYMHVHVHMTLTCSWQQLHLHLHLHL